MTRDFRTMGLQHAGRIQVFPWSTAPAFPAEFYALQGANYVIQHLQLTLQLKNRFIQVHQSPYREERKHESFERLRAFRTTKRATGFTDRGPGSRSMG